MVARHAGRARFTGEKEDQLSRDNVFRARLGVVLLLALSVLALSGAARQLLPGGVDRQHQVSTLYAVVSAVQGVITSTCDNSNVPRVPLGSPPSFLRD